MSEIADKLRAFFKREMPNHGDIADDRPLLESGILDSLAVVKLLAFIERDLGVEITDNEFDPDNFETIGTIAALVAERKAS